MNFSFSNQIAPGETAVRRFALRRDSAFTMVEIALCLAIVGFAIVAIIGVLPAGLNVQRDNREETIVNQDSSIWIDAIRSGARGYDHLTNYVDRIVVLSSNYDATSTFLGEVKFVGERAPVGTGFELNSGARIVGMLSTPRFGAPTAIGAAFSQNYVYAYVRAISGGAAEKAPQLNQDVLEGSFGYRMVVDLTPESSVDPAGIKNSREDFVKRQNLSHLRLLCRWPLREPYSPNLALDRPLTGNRSIVFRTDIGGFMPPPVGDPNLPPDPALNNVPFYFIQPRDYKIKP